MDENFFKRLLATYKIEAQEHLQVMSAGMLDYESSTDDTKKNELIEDIFRAAHSLKGASRAVNLTEVEAMCKNLEYIFSALKRGDLKTSPALFDTLHKAFDSISLFLSTDDENQKFQYAGDIKKITERLSIDHFQQQLPENSSIQSLHENLKQEPEVKIEDSTSDHPDNHKTALDRISLSSDMIRVSATKLDSLFLQSEQLLAVKLANDQTADELFNMQRNIEQWKREWNKVNNYFRRLKSKSENTISAKTRDEEDTKFVDFIERNNSLITELNETLKKLTKLTRQNNRTFGGMLTELTDDLKEILMLPYSSLADLFPKLVRDLSRDLNKDVGFEITGAELQADRRILEEIRDPLIHLVRNSIDHGIEIPAERIRKGKDPRGKIKVSVEKLEGNKIRIIFEDDGKGIDIASLKRSAVEKEIITREDARSLKDSEAISLIFHSGISTSRVITDISGHGLGLAIVREKAEKLGGVVDVETETDKGTRFIITLPHTLATFRGIVISCSDRLFVVPVANVEMVLTIDKENLRTIENKETVFINNAPVSLVFLSDILDLNRKGIGQDGLLNIVLLQASGKIIAMAIDKTLYEQEILVKPFNKQLARVRNISGAAVLGNGKIVPVLNVPDIVKSAEKLTPGAALAESALSSDENAYEKNILVVDDSITSRMLLKDILESAGYNVKTAIDGIDAMTTLRVENFDLVVSDIEMPRMDGFDLCRSIRRDERFSSVPVVLVTALSRREDREKGIDSGANAYIVKSSFDQSNLLETVKRLL